MHTELTDSDKPPSTNVSWWSRLFSKPKPLSERDLLVRTLQSAREEQVLDKQSHDMIKGVMAISQMQVRDVMLARAQMVVLQADDEREEFLTTVIESGHSRFPVVSENREEVIGILLAKDLLKFLKSESEIDIEDLLRTPLIVPESMRLDDLLTQFKSARNHMAIVADEYGGIAGLITIEDVLEKIVGDIDDEHDIEEDKAYKQIAPKRYQVNSLMPVEEFNTVFKAKLRIDEFDTIGGLVLQRFGKVPERGDEIALGHFKFKVLRADARRLYLLELTTP